MRKGCDNLFERVSGKEGFQILMSTFLEAWKGDIPSISEAEVARMIAGFRRNSAAGHAYNAWCKAANVILYTSQEARIWALKIENKIMLLTLSITDRSYWDNGMWSSQLETLHEEIQIMISLYEGQLHLLQAFSEAVCCDFTGMIAEEHATLRAYIGLYNSTLLKIPVENDHFDYSISVRENASAKVQRHLVSEIEGALGTEFWSVRASLHE